MKKIVCKLMVALSLFFIMMASLHAKEPLIITHSKELEPYIFSDGNGVSQGILVDIWRLYAERNNQPIQFKLTDWSASLDNLKDGSADVHAGMVASDKRDIDFDFIAKPLASLYTRLYFTKKISHIPAADYLNGGKVGVLRNSYQAAYAYEHFTQAEIIEYNNTREMLQAVYNNEINAVAAIQYITHYYLVYDNYADALVPVQDLFERKIYAAVKHGNNNLLKKLNAGFNKITQQELDGIFKRWIQVEVQYPKYLFWTLAALALFMLISYTALLKHQVRVKTKDLKRAIDALNERNKELEYLNTIDPMTDIFNRKTFIDSLKGTIKESRTSYALVLLDIDKFKNINDTYGHLNGDKTIIHVVDFIRERLPEKATFGRLGGEEFAYFYPCESLAQAEKQASDVVTTLPQQFLQLEGESIRITVSTGVVFSTPPLSSYIVLMTKADELMYQSKHAGRNTYHAEEIVSLQKDNGGTSGYRNKDIHKQLSLGSI